MTTVIIQGYGQYQISTEHVQSLLNWLAQNSGVRTQTNEQNMVPPQFAGKDLING